MVKTDDFNTFATSALSLCRAQPDKVRYVTKYKTASDGKSILTLRVTDNTTCLVFKTSKQEDLEKVERLNKAFLQLMSASDL
jgi:signal recognition particle subunit SRP9